MLLSLILSVILVSLASSYILLAWFDGAKFLLEYLKLLKLDSKIPTIKEYNDSKSQGSPLDFLEYISEYKDTFITRLVTCPKCLSLWVAGFFWIVLSILLAISTRDCLSILFLPIAAPASASISYLIHKLIK